MSVVNAAKDSKRALLQLSGETMSADTLVPGLTMQSLPPKRTPFRTIRQQQIAKHARDKLTKLRADPLVGGVDADVSAASTAAPTAAPTVTAAPSDGCVLTLWQ